MLDAEYVNMLNHYLDVLLDKETVGINLKVLLDLKRDKLNTYFYNVELINILELCRKRAIKYEIIEIYSNIIKGLQIEVSIGIRLN